VKNGAGDGLDLRRTLGSGRKGFWADGLGCHDPIVACWKQASQMPGIPSHCEGISFLWASMPCVYVRHGA
jgi:hypothetical protein